MLCGNLVAFMGLLVLEFLQTFPSILFVDTFFL